MSWLTGLGPAELIAAAALISSFVIGALNYAHTRRQFRAAHLAALQADLWYHDHWDRLDYQIKNLSADRTVAEVRLIILMRRSRSWPYNGPWTTYFEMVRVSLEPRQQHNGATTEREPRVSQWVGVHFPRYLTKQGDAWHILDHRPLRVRLVVRYFSGAHGARRLKYERQYYLHPVTNAGTGRKLHSWDLKDAFGKSWRTS